MRSVCSQPCSHDGPSARLAASGPQRPRQGGLCQRWRFPRAQACYHCSQAAEKALTALLLALDQEPERTHSIERLLGDLELLGIETAPLRLLPHKPL
jgi:hypothetical protein